MKFRKKPVVIEAVQLTWENAEELAKFVTVPGFKMASIDGESLTAIIPTLEDGDNHQVQHFASYGDWIIKGVKNEFYPCKPDIFAQTYEPV
jgi:hypothetical protein